jgi:hypothetical protein
MAAADYQPRRGTAAAASAAAAAVAGVDAGRAVAHPAAFAVVAFGRAVQLAPVAVFGKQRQRFRRPVAGVGGDHSAAWA